MESNIDNNKVHTHMFITILNIIFGIGIVLVPLVALIMTMFADTQAGVDAIAIVVPLGFYYPFVAIFSIYMSRHHNSYWYAFAPLLFLFIYPIFATINPHFFGAPLNWICKLVFGSKLF